MLAVRRPYRVASRRETRSYLPRWATRQRNRPDRAAPRYCGGYPDVANPIGHLRAILRAKLIMPVALLIFTLGRK